MHMCGVILGYVKSINNSVLYTFCLLTGQEDTGRFQINYCILKVSLILHMVNFLICSLSSYYSLVGITHYVTYGNQRHLKLPQKVTKVPLNIL
jgi:hypothetical protein